jgi:hypothetical protein
VVREKSDTEVGGDGGMRKNPTKERELDEERERLTVGLGVIERERWDEREGECNSVNVYLFC